MKSLEYGKGYQYAHDSEEKLTNMQCLPDSLEGREYYIPTEQGKRRAIKRASNRSKTGKSGGNRRSSGAGAGSFGRSSDHRSRSRNFCSDCTGGLI